MRPTAARLARQSVFVAVFAAPMLVAACGNPVAPVAAAGRVAADGGRDSTSRTGGSQPWFEAGKTDSTAKSGGSQPWFDTAKTDSTGKSGGSQPWF